MNTNELINIFGDGAVEARGRALSENGMQYKTMKCSNIEALMDRLIRRYGIVDFYTDNNGVVRAQSTMNGFTTLSVEICSTEACA